MDDSHVVVLFSSSCWMMNFLAFCLFFQRSMTIDAALDVGFPDADVTQHDTDTSPQKFLSFPPSDLNVWFFPISAQFQHMTLALQQKNSFFSHILEAFLHIFTTGTISHIQCCVHKNLLKACQNHELCWLEAPSWNCWCLLQEGTLVGGMDTWGGMWRTVTHFLSFLTCCQSVASLREFFDTIWQKMSKMWINRIKSV